MLRYQHRTCRICKQSKPKCHAVQKLQARKLRLLRWHFRFAKFKLLISFDIKNKINPEWFRPFRQKFMEQFRISGMHFGSPIRMQSPINVLNENEWTENAVQLQIKYVDAIHLIAIETHLICASHLLYLIEWKPESTINYLSGKWNVSNGMAKKSVWFALQHFRAIVKGSIKKAAVKVFFKFTFTPCKSRFIFCPIEQKISQFFSRENTFFQLYNLWGIRILMAIDLEVYLW